MIVAIEALEEFLLVLVALEDRGLVEVEHT